MGLSWRSRVSSVGSVGGVWWGWDDRGQVTGPSVVSVAWVV